MKQRIAAGGALVAVAAGIAASAASGSITVPSFQVTPSAPKAGAAGVSLSFDAHYASSDGDSAQNVTISMPKGFGMSASVVPVACTDAQLQGNACPADSQIGTTATTVLFAGQSITSQGKAYLVAPQPGEDARLGLAYSTVLGAVYQEAIVTGTVAGGLKISYPNVADTELGQHIQLTDNTLAVNGVVNGKPFTKIPSACVSAPFVLTATSWNDPAAVTATAAFQPTACAKPKPKAKPKAKPKHRPAPKKKH
jgi:hypothetical protein